MSAPCTLHVLFLEVSGVVRGPGAGIGGQPGEIVVVGIKLWVVLGGRPAHRDPDRPADGNRGTWEAFRLFFLLGRARFGLAARLAERHLDLAVPDEDHERREDRPLERVAPAQTVAAGGPAELPPAEGEASGGAHQPQDMPADPRRRPEPSHALRIPTRVWGLPVGRACPAPPQETS